jgi:hypothetical protein
MQPIISPISEKLVLSQVGYVALPEHHVSGGFDHTAVHAPSGQVYVAHTANSAADVLEPASQKHLYSVLKLSGVAGVSDEADDHELIAAESTVYDAPCKYCLEMVRRDMPGGQFR